MQTCRSFWFIVVAVFWTGFFVLEGFDFGVGMLHRFVGRTDVERRVAINTIGPFWDGNEVWLIVAGAAIFAAFPAGTRPCSRRCTCALVLLLVALIVRGVSFEFRGKGRLAPLAAHLDMALMTVGSLLAPLLLGVALGDLLAGLPIDAEQDFTGTFLDLLTPYGLWIGVTLLVLCLLHGATFLGCTTTGDVQRPRHALARRRRWPAARRCCWWVWTPGDRRRRAWSPTCSRSSACSR